MTNIGASNGLLRQYLPKSTDLARHTEPTWTPSRTPSTAGPVRPWSGQPRPKPSTGYCQTHQYRVLQRPPEPKQYTSVHFGETLLLNGMLPSIGTVGDAFDNALADDNGLYKHQCIRADSPFRGPLDKLSDLEMITADWVHWYNESRLMHHLGRIPPAEAEANYYATTRDGRPAAHT